MESYFQGFPEDELFSANLLHSDFDEVMKDQLVGLEGFKMDESWEEEIDKTENAADREDFQQIMSDWQQHLGSLNTADSEELGLGLDTNLDILNNYSSCDLFGELESPILSKALKYPGQKQNINIQPLGKTLEPIISRDSFLENLGSYNKSNSNNQKISELVKTEPNIIKKVTLINSEKEILGKNIVGLHCLNEIKENPDENCQVTSTIINGKRYKIIIKPKSLRVKKLSEDKIRKTLIKKLNQCHLVTKMEPGEDQNISEMCKNSFHVPIISSDLLPSWDWTALDFQWSNQGKNVINTAVEKTEMEPERKVSSHRVITPKLKKPKKKWSVRSDQEFDLETVNDTVVEGHTLGTLLKNFEEKIAKIEKNVGETNDGNNSEERSNLTYENIKNCLPKEMINKIETLKHKEHYRIPLIQAMPTKKPAKNGTRMQDAVATMNRNKLLKIVSSGDSVQLDHDYCSTFIKTSVIQKDLKKSIDLDTNLAEKNPKKDSGMESGDVSDASEGPNTPDYLHNLQALRPVNNKVLEEHHRIGDHLNVTKAAITFFRASNAASVNWNISSSDSVKTKTVSNGNKALTNDNKKSNCHSDCSCTVSSEFNVKDTNDNRKPTENIDIQKIENPVEKCSPVQSERPRKKLKLEEYLSRRHVKEKEREKITNCNGLKETGNNNDVIKSVQNSNIEKSKLTETYCENTQEKSTETQSFSNRIKVKKGDKDKKFWKSQGRRSSAGSSRERRRRSRSKSRSRWRSSSKCSENRRRKGQGKQRRSESRERINRRGFWSGSLSRSSSRESSTSSDHSVDKHCRDSSPRCRRRKRSRSISQDRSNSQNRVFNRRPDNYYYYKRNLNYRRSKSPFYAYSMREKQRQIEERRVIYVGRIEEGMTNAKLRERFSIFGPIIDISLHFREYGDNYGFVTYAYKADAYDAVEHGNDDPTLPHYDLCFGGRRGFCKEKYADLDGMPTSYSGFNDSLCIQNSKDSFDLLLKEAQAKLKNRKKQWETT